jgi:hypothetical protein
MSSRVFGSNVPKTSDFLQKNSGALKYSLDKKMASDIYVKNIIADEVVSIQTTIPPDTSNFLQIFPIAPNFYSNTKKAAITKITATIDSAGIYNIQESEDFYKDGVLSTIDPGQYNLEDLISIISITVPTHGAYANKAVLTTHLQLRKNAQLIHILGLEEKQCTIMMNDYLSFPMGTRANNAIDITAGLNMLLIGCSLISLDKYLHLICIDKLGPTYSNTSESIIPILKGSYPSIQWYLRNKFGHPVKIYSAITIHMLISIWNV